MNIGIVVLANNAVSYIERLLLSIHSQKHSDWHLFIIDIGSTDRIESVLEDLRRKPTFGQYYGTRNCDIFKDKISYYQIAPDNSLFLDVVEDILKSNIHLVTFMAANWRLDSNILELIAQHPNIMPMEKIVFINLKAHDLNESNRLMYFYGKENLMQNPIPLSLSKSPYGEYDVQFNQSGIFINFGKTTYGTAFKKD